MEGAMFKHLPPELSNSLRVLHKTPKKPKEQLVVRHFPNPYPDYSFDNSQFLKWKSKVSLFIQML